MPTGGGTGGTPGAGFSVGDRVTNKVAHPGWADGNVHSVNPFEVKWDDKGAPIPEVPSNLSKVVNHGGTH